MEISDLRPDIVFINVDQMCLRAISAFGSGYARTPHIDRLVNNGTSFMHTYAAEPICTPARASWWTGRYPSEHGVVYNSTNCHDDIPDLGQHLRNSGYNALFVGKWHVDGRDVEKSFDVTHEGGWWGEITDQDVTKSAVAILRNYNSDKPLFLNIGYLNPHDCCLTVFDDLADGAPEILECGLVDKGKLPSLPETYHYDGTMNGTVEFVLYRHMAAKSFDDIRWRYYIYKYARLCEMVDHEIGAVLDEIEISRRRDNTLIIFSSDHGDGVSNHRMNGKSTLWDESVRVPFVISSLSDSGRIRKGLKDYDHFVSGVDIFPTVCGAAGVPMPEGFSGIDVFGVATGDGIGNPRGFAYAESMFYSRMIRSKRYKYIMDYVPQSDDSCRHPTHRTHKIYRELLYDMEERGEMEDLSHRGGHDKIVAQHRLMLFDMEDRLQYLELRKGGRTPDRLFKGLQGYFEHFGIDVDELLKKGKSPAVEGKQ